MIRVSSFGLTVMLCCGLSTFRLSDASGGDGSPGPSDDQTVHERNQTSRLADDELKRWRFTSRNGRKSLSIAAEPAMRWSHFDIGRYYGDLYVVTDQKRPVAIFALFRWFHPTTRAYVCATSLDNSQFVASRNGTTRWQPRTSALKWKPLPKTEPPSKSRTYRLVQMRRIASRFSGEVSDQLVADQTALKKLRLLPQPIYRYSTRTADGAIFAFANGTNPAVLLCLEADLGEKTIGWRYGFARRWSFESRMSNEHGEIWRVPLVRPPTSRDAPYFLATIPIENVAD